MQTRSAAMPSKKKASSDNDNDDDDTDYKPDESEDEDEESEKEESESESESGDEEINIVNDIMNMQNSSFMVIINTEEAPQPQNKRHKNNNCEITKSLAPEERDYWNKLSDVDKARMLTLYREIKNNHEESTTVPMRFKLINSDIDLPSKKLIMIKLEQFQKMPQISGEYYKLRNWLNGISRLPLGKYFPLPVTPSDSHLKCSEFLIETRKKLDATVYGHYESKDQIMRILAQWISNPESRGHCIGIHGPPGVAKTILIKEGICKALGLPFGFIALGGASDASFLEGHSFTYEGSTYGKIAELLMKTQCMNPVIFFDELDKVSNTFRGDEIIGILTHLTDTSQNEKFNDKFFGEIDLNMSKSLIIFSYNDETRINPILKDRMITIRVNGYSNKEKLTIAKNHLLPEIMKQYKFAENDIIFNDEIIEMIIQRVTNEEGVRNLKRGLEAIVSWINMLRYLPQEDMKNRNLPITIIDSDVKRFLKTIDTNPSLSMMYM